jgi:hypothetical protein
MTIKHHKVQYWSKKSQGWVSIDMYRGLTNAFHVMERYAAANNNSEFRVVASNGAIFLHDNKLYKCKLSNWKIEGF